MPECVVEKYIASYVCDESMKVKNSNLNVRMLLLYDSYSYRLTSYTKKESC